MIDLQFQALGFSSKETQAYLSLAEIGKCTAQLLGKRLGVPRTTAYSVLDSLVAKGMVSIEKRKNSTFYTANAPEVLRRILEKQKQVLEEKEKVAAEVINQRKSVV